MATTITLEDADIQDILNILSSREFRPTVLDNFEAAIAAAAPAAPKKSKPSMDAIKAKAAKAKAAPATTKVTKAEVEKQLEDAPY